MISYGLVVKLGSCLYYNWLLIIIPWKQLLRGSLIYKEMLYFCFNWFWRFVPQRYCWLWRRILEKKRWWVLVGKKHYQLYLSDIVKITVFAKNSWQWPATRCASKQNRGIAHTWCYWLLLLVNSKTYTVCFQKSVKHLLQRRWSIN